MPAKIQVIFYSTFGHVFRLAEAIVQGAKDAGDTQVELFQVAETLPREVLEKMGAVEAKKAFAHVPLATVDHLTDADAIILGTPTRYGAATAQMQTFLDATGQLWMKGTLIGKIGSCFTSTASQHGGQETTIVHMHTFLLHQGMIVVGCPYAAKELLTLAEITGGSPYGASTISGGEGSNGRLNRGSAIM